MMMLYTIQETRRPHAAQSKSVPKCVAANDIDRLLVLFSVLAGSVTRIAFR